MTIAIAPIVLWDHQLASVEQEAPTSHPIPSSSRDSSSPVPGSNQPAVAKEQ